MALVHKKTVAKNENKKREEMEYIAMMTVQLLRISDRLGSQEKN